MVEGALEWVVGEGVDVVVALTRSIGCQELLVRTEKEEKADTAHLVMEEQRSGDCGDGRERRRQRRERYEPLAPVEVALEGRDHRDGSLEVVRSGKAEAVAGLSRGEDE